MTLQNLLPKALIFLGLFVSLGTIAAPLSKSNTKTSGETCSNLLTQSQFALKAILDDLPNHYDQVGGGISGIKLTATNVYVVSIAQEERIDQLTYHFEANSDCTIKILKRELSAISPWEQE